MTFLPLRSNPILRLRSLRAVSIPSSPGASCITTKHVCCDANGCHSSQRLCCHRAVALESLSVVSPVGDSTMSIVRHYCVAGHRILELYPPDQMQMMGSLPNPSSLPPTVTCSTEWHTSQRGGLSRHFHPPRPIPPGTDHEYRILLCPSCRSVGAAACGMPSESVVLTFSRPIRDDSFAILQPCSSHRLKRLPAELFHNRSCFAAHHCNVALPVNARQIHPDAQLPRPNLSQCVVRLATHGHQRTTLRCELLDQPPISVFLVGRDRLQIYECQMYSIPRRLPGCLVGRPTYNRCPMLVPCRSDKQL